MSPILFILLLNVYCIQFGECLLAPWSSRVTGNPIPNNILFIFMALFISAMLRLILRRIRVRIPDMAFVMLVGALFGVCGEYSVFVADRLSFAFIHASLLLVIFIPALMFKISLSIEVQSLLRSWFQVAMIAVVAFLITSSLLGFLMLFVLGESWPYYNALLFGALCSPIYPQDVLISLNDIGYQTKHLICLFEGEAICVTCCVMFIYRTVANYRIHEEVYTTIMMSLWFVIGGLLMAYVFGKVNSLIVKPWYNSPRNLMMWTLVSPYAAYHLTNNMLEVSAVLVIVGIGLSISVDRLSFAVEADKHLIHFWEFVSHIVHTIIIFIIGVRAAHELFKHEPHTMLFIFICYIMANVTRFLGLLLISPILYCCKNHLTFQDLLVLNWGGLRCIIGPLLALLSFGREETESQKPSFTSTLFLYPVGIVFLTTLINAPTMHILLKYLGLADVSMVRKTNMNNCLKYIMLKREHAIFTLKLDRFLSDANWPLIEISTVLKHPYQMKNIDSEEEEASYAAYRISICPVCTSEVIDEPTAKELEEMYREAKLRVLKAEKISYMRQYEYGMLSMDGIRILQSAVDLAAESDEALFDIDCILKIFYKKTLSTVYRDFMLRISKREVRRIRPPRRYYRRLCYHIIIHPAFDIIMSIIILVNLIPIIIELVMPPTSKSTMAYALAGVNSFFFLAYLCEFLFKVNGLAWIYLCSHGFKLYFKSLWNVFDFVVLLVAFADLLFDIADITTQSFSKADSNASTFTLIAKMTRVVRFARLFKLCQAWYPRIISYFERRIDTTEAFAFEVGKSYLNATEEVLDALPLMIDNVEIRTCLRKHIERDRSLITKELGLVQRKRPIIAITVKTKQAMKTTLNNMKDAVRELKAAGWLDDYEYARLHSAIIDRLKMVKNIRSLRPNEPKMIFREIAYMSGNEELAESLLSNAHTKTLDTGDVVCREGHVADGIYIIVTGLLVSNYAPKKDFLEQRNCLGTLPVMDYLTSPYFNERLSDYLVSGNTFGELSTLTARPYNSHVIAETPCEVYFLPRDLVVKTLQQDTDIIYGLESRIWKDISIRLALSILMEVPSYQSLSQDKIKMILERAFIPKLSAFKTFIVNEMIEDLILIEGLIVDFHTRDLYIGPCHIPRTVQKIVLPASSMFDVHTTVIPRIMVIPVKDQDPYDLMENEEQVSQMVTTRSSKCLYHTAQRSSLISRRRRPGNVFRRPSKVDDLFLSRTTAIIQRSSVLPLDREYSMATYDRTLSMRTPGGSFFLQSVSLRSPSSTGFEFNYTPSTSVGQSSRSVEAKKTEKSGQKKH